MNVLVKALPNKGKEGQLIAGLGFMAIGALFLYKAVEHFYTAYLTISVM